MKRDNLNRYKRPDQHPRSRRRLNRALKEFARVSEASEAFDRRPSLGSCKSFVVATVGALVKGLSRDRPEPEPVSPEVMAFRRATDELVRALDARARALNGFDAYEAETIVADARKAVEVR